MPALLSPMEPCASTTLITITIMYAVRQVISTDKAPGAVGPYSQGTKTGNLVFVSGQLGFIPGVRLLLLPKCTALHKPNALHCTAPCLCLRRVPSMLSPTTATVRSTIVPFSAPKPSVLALFSIPARKYNILALPCDHAKRATPRRRRILLQMMWRARPSRSCSTSALY